MNKNIKMLNTFDVLFINFGEAWGKHKKKYLLKKSNNSSQRRTLVLSINWPEYILPEIECLYPDLWLNFRHTFVICRLW